MMIGYARVSTDDQNFALRPNVLRAAGCNPAFEDQGVSGAITVRPGLILQHAQGLLASGVHTCAGAAALLGFHVAKLRRLVRRSVAL